MRFDSLLLAVENAFGFAIAEKDIADLKTLGNLFEYVLTHRFRGKKQDRLTSIALYRIRRVMMSVLHLSRNELQESANLSSLLPKNRRHLWQLLQERAGLRLPQLRRPLWLVRVAISIAVALSVATPVFFSLPLFRGAFLVATLTAFIAGHLLFQVTKLGEVEFQPGCATLGELATGVMARNFQTIGQDSVRFLTDAQVWETLCSVVAAQLGVRPYHLTWDTRLSQDRSLDFGDKPLLLPIPLIDSTLTATTESYA